MRKRSRGRHAAEGGDEALIDRFFGESEGPSRRTAERREKQLCREVFRVLAESITCAEIVEVRPFPDTSRLAVAVRFWPGDDASSVLERLRCDKGRLRADIARSLQRKRTPDLYFEAAP
jgi:ribosome-binding factor A